ncbi:type II toxin-antitoxin system Phd/YefM family antitoxin [Microcoleus sp. CAWBG58]|uniref:type II toxin-antitoxin system Phd/YefM family antitoxin n=1 Tax=Microcoleus sp. CAWBG58 TaxID=2841651 RepID=UPI0025E0C6C0|nr:type II toxin-antitoxin system Phd/YefM family antitoxin [Microcoleus sp. CAWBG58]
MIPINESQPELQQSIDSVSESHQPIALEHTSNTVLLSEAESASVQETLDLLSVPGMRESIREGMATSIEECDRHLDW